MAGDNWDFLPIGKYIDDAKNGLVTTWLAPGVIVESGSTLLYGLPGAAKSLVGMDLGHAASTGGKWLNVFDLGCPHGVLYVDEDGNNSGEFNKRLLDFGYEPNPNWHCITHRNFLLTDDVARRTVIRKCQERGKTLVILDSLTRLHRSNESSSGDMKLVSAAIKDFCAVGITVVMLHHATKQGNSFRGSSEIAAAYDGVLSLKKTANDLVTMRAEKVRSVGPNGVWEGCDITITTDASGHLVLDGSLPPSGSRSQEAEALRENVIGLLQDGGELHQTAIARALKLSSRRYDDLDRCLVALVEEGVVDCERRGKATYYTPVDADPAEDDGE